jgi:hypothetical protein
MTIAYSGYGIPTPDSMDLNRTAPRIRYRRNINALQTLFKKSIHGQMSVIRVKNILKIFSVVKKNM